MSFHKSSLYAAIVANNPTDVANILGRGEDATVVDGATGDSYLHLVACVESCKRRIVSALLDRVDIMQRNDNGETALDIASGDMASMLSGHVMTLLWSADTEKIQEMMDGGWETWPGRWPREITQNALASQYLTDKICDISKRAMDVHYAVRSGLPGQLDKVTSYQTDGALRDAINMTPLHRAVLLEDTQMVRHLVEKFPAAINLIDHMGRAPLHYAALLYDMQQIHNILLIGGADAELIDKNGRKASYYEDNKTEIDKYELLSLSNTMLKLPAAQRRKRLLHEAIIQGDLRSVRQLIERRTDVTFTDTLCMSALHAAVTHQRFQIAKHLVQRFPETVHCMDYWGRTPLHYAAIWQSANFYELLLGEGADESIKDYAGVSAKEQMAKKQSDVNFETIIRNTRLLMSILPIQDRVLQLHRAVESGDLGKVKALLDRVLLVSARDTTGLGLIHKAVVFRKRKVLKYFIRNYPEEVNATDHMGRTALHYAGAIYSEDSGATYKLLQKASAMENKEDMRSNLPRHYRDGLHKIDVNKLRDRTLNKSPRLLQLATPLPPASKTEATQEKVEKVHIPVNSDDPYALRGIPEPTGMDSKYIARVVGPALAMGLAELVIAKPRDPILQLGIYLKHYAGNVNRLRQAAEEKNDIETAQREAQQEREKAAKRRKEQRIIAETEHQAALLAAEQARIEQEEKDKVMEVHKAPSPGVATRPQTAVTKRDERGRTLLHITAAMHGAEEEVLGLLEDGYNATDRDEDGNTAKDHAQKAGLHDSIMAVDDHIAEMFAGGDVWVIQQLVLTAYTPQIPDIEEKLGGRVGMSKATYELLQALPLLQERISELFRLVERGGELRHFKHMLNQRVMLTARDTRGQSLLHVAVRRKRVSFVRYLLAAGGTVVDSRDNMNRTALHFAYAIAERGIIDDLLKSGANENAMDVKNHPPSYYSEKGDEIGTALVEAV